MLRLKNRRTIILMTLMGMVMIMTLTTVRKMFLISLTRMEVRLGMGKGNGSCDNSTHLMETIIIVGNTTRIHIQILAHNTRKA